MAGLDRVEAAVRAGRAETARAWVPELDDFARGTGAAWAVAIAEHGRALLANPPEAELHFQRALSARTLSMRLPDRARTELAFGEALRRARRRVDARAQLRDALKTFEDLGGGPWAERARQELRASGEIARRRDASADPRPIHDRRGNFGEGPELLRRS